MSPSQQRGFDFVPARNAVPGADPSSAIAVSALTELAKRILEGGFTAIWVRGEVTGFKQHSNGHWYFTLRDRMAQINSVVWSKDARSIPALPDEGMQVAAYGNLSVYPTKGIMQFIVRRMEAAGQVVPIYRSASVPGGDEHNHTLESRYAGRIRRTA